MYTKFNYKQPPHECESWDQYIVRKMIEEREYNESKNRQNLGNDRTTISHSNDRSSSDQSQAKNEMFYPSTRT